MLSFESTDNVQLLVHFRGYMDLECCGEKLRCLIVSMCLSGTLPSPVDSIRLAVLTVSPNKQYRGILVPTMPATTGPVCTPHRICSVSSVLRKRNAKMKTCNKSTANPRAHRLGILKNPDASSRSRAIVAISEMCLFPAIECKLSFSCCIFCWASVKPFFTGNPEATMYESPIVSTL